VTDDSGAAIRRVRAFLAAWDERHTARDQVLVQVKPGSADMLTSDDLRALLAAAEPGQPIAELSKRCAHCGKPLDDNATANYLGAKVCHTRTQPPYAHPTDCYRLLTEGEELGARDLRTYRDKLADRLIDKHLAAARASDVGVLEQLTGAPGDITPEDEGIATADVLAQIAADQRHRPLTDEPCGVIPTKAGLSYLTNRRQQHPKATTDA
jgi:hypothetical protein